MRINQNTMANNAYRNLSTNNISLGKSLEKLSSGFRINRAADDAAGLVISQTLRAQTSGLRQATRNAQDGISVVQTAEGALNEVHTILNRMRDLSVQAANTGTNDDTALNAAQAEITALSSEVNRIATTAEFSGKKLLNGNYGVNGANATGTAVLLQVTDVPDFTFTVTGDPGVAHAAVTVADLKLLGGVANAAKDASSVETAINAALKAAGSANAGKVSVSAAETTGFLTIKLNDVPANTTFALSPSGLSDLGAVGSTNMAAGSGGTFQVGANAGAGNTVSVRIGNMGTSSTGLNIDTANVVTNASAAITTFDAAIKTVSKQRGELGALQNRFESMINNLQVTTENLVASESRIRDTDMAAEMTNFTKNQILSQAGTAMLAQANQVPQSILSLLR